MKRQKHSMDLVFALVLFAGFAVCAMLLVLLGARIYSRTAQTMNTVDTPVFLSYLTEKLRSSDGAEAVSVGEDGSLQIGQEMEGGVYVTWIYVEDGSLKESLMSQGQAPIAGAGTVIGQISVFWPKFLTKNLLEIEVMDEQGKTGHRYYHFPV
ncbi:MAG: DUF4860 domain-containing protein [Lachnospiraceae bacterium]|nr:DUF4860 domain-containing protein [Lachnospiraceae bacterium]